MKKLPTFITTLITFLFFSGLFVLAAYAQSTDDSTAQSPCVLTQIGNPPANQALPPGCGSESAIVQKVIALARSRINNNNITYLSAQPNRDWSTENPNGHDPTLFDCSGFVGWAWYWGSNGVISMGGQTNYDWANEGHNPHYEKVVTSDESQLQPGDAIYINNHIPGDTQPGHVGLYIGKDTDPSSTCHANDCYMQFNETGHPGNEESLKADGGSSILMGYIRMKNP
jgi:NlpC/P60 family protein